ncbi:hypothetical protein ZOSMA_115G00080 [Zostera marina]|uniref:J domain-containing protein n=1 Tax=Zostera marina TaxID=29655 RepID=A0A0K9Q4C1_ZOSMR|nr:hypothetical protein ZOSMA_115G00080 [Zostera marina]
MQSPAYFNQKELHQQRRRRSHRPQTHQNSGQKDQQQQTSTDPKSFSPIKTSDYGEIFGGYSYSIPVLDLPPVPCADAGSGTSCFRSSVPIDLVDIFGGFADSRFGVPYEEILNHGTSASSLNGGLDKETKHDVFQSSQASNLNGGSGIKSSQANGVAAKKGFDRSGDNPNVEDTSANEQYHSCSSSDESEFDCPGAVKLEDTCSVHSASSLTSSPSSAKSPKGISHQQQKMSEFDTSVTSKKTTSANPPISMIKNDHKHDQLYVKSFSNSSKSSSVSDKAYTNTRFITVSDINLRTQPSAVPPPARPPPRVCNSEGGIKAESFKPTVKADAYCLDKNVYKASSNKETKSILSATGSSRAAPFFNMDTDVGSEAAASLAAMREAMEQAQARLKSAKVSMERKKESLQNWKKTITKVKERKLNETVPVMEINNQMISQETSENDRRPKIISVGNVVPDLEANERYFDLAEESLRRKNTKEIDPTQVSYIQDEREGKWKVKDQFFELVNNDNKSTGVHQIFEDDSNDKNSKAYPKPKADKSDKKMIKLAPELKTNDFVFAGTGNYEVNHRDAKLNEGSNVCAVEETKEILETIPDEYSQENDEKEDAILSEVLLDDQTQLHDDKRQLHEDDKKESDKFYTRLNEISETSGTNVFSESKMEVRKSTCFEEIDAHKEFVKVVDTTSNESISSDYNDNKLNASRSLLHPHQNEQGIEPQHESYIREHANHLELTYACEEDESGIKIKNHHAEDHLMQSGHDKSEFKPMGSGKIEDCSSKQNEENMHTVDENEAIIEKSRWKYFCDKIIKEAQQGDGEEHVPSKLDDEHNIKANIDTRHCDDNMVYEVASNRQENISMKGAAQVVLQSAVTEKELDDSCRNTLVDRNVESEKDKSSVAAFTSEESRRDKMVERELEEEMARKQEERSMKQEEEIAKKLEEERTRKLEEEIAREEEKERIRKQEEEIAGEEEKERIRKQEERIRKQEEERTRKLEEERTRKLEEERTRKLEEEEMIRKLEEENERKREREREIIDSRRRVAAEKAAVDRANFEARQRAFLDIREKAIAGAIRAEKIKKEARMRAERAAVEKATAEVRQRAAEKSIQDAREREEQERIRNTIYREGRDQQRNYSGARQNSQNGSDVYPGRNESETPMRQKARLERTKRTHDRAKRALEEKNKRDVMSQREVDERQRISSTLDADIRRWSNGKEGNLRALLSTLQYILGPESKWKPISLTEIITASAVKTAYKKSTLCVHPDKLQQRNASVRDKYVAEKVFELLTNAWYKFNSEER